MTYADKMCTLIMSLFGFMGGVSLGSVCLKMNSPWSGFLTLVAPFFECGNIPQCCASVCFTGKVGFSLFLMQGG